MVPALDFLVNNNRMPPMIVVGIANTDRTRPLTPTHADFKNPDGSVNALPTSGGADRFLDFIQTELMSEIEKRYRTAPYRIFAGHSLGGLLAIHTLITRPDLNNLGYQLMGAKKFDEAIAVFKQNVEFYPGSANVYDSLGEGLEAAGKFDSATQNFQKAIEMATKNNDGTLPEFKRHLERVTAEVKAAASKNAHSQ
jgi:tetratricopeptide (TPR) repeat protein